MTPESQPGLQLEIGHLLLIDVVGYSKLLVNEQIELLQELNRVVRHSAAFRAAESAEKLIRLPTGDGMALIFFRSPEEPVQCALQVQEELRAHPDIRVRMGIHSGPISHTVDVNDRSNVAGTGINLAQRVMDCGDAGHILLSKHLADDLSQYRAWKPFLHDLGECEVKHGLRLHLVNLHKDGCGNPALPRKLKGRSRWKAEPASSRRPIGLWIALVLALAAMSVGAFFFWRNRSVTLPGVPEKSIAVLPFDNFSEDDRNPHMPDAVQDEILTDLAKVADLKVISRTSVMPYRDAAARRNVREIGRQLGVAHLLEGSVQCIGSRVRVTAQLIDTRSDTHIWAESYVREMADVFALESEISEKIVAQLTDKLSPREKASIEEKPTGDLAAYDYYFRGKRLIERAVSDPMPPQKLANAIELLNEAVRLDPSFPLAYYQLAHAHDQIYLYGDDHSPNRLALAEEAIRALEKLRPGSGEAHLARAKHYYWGYLDFDHARLEVKAARPALPNDPWPLLLSSYIDRRQSHWSESTASLESALALDPRNPLVLHQLALTYQCLRRYPEMRAMVERALALNPKDATVRVQRASIDLDEKAALQPLRETLAQIQKETPGSAAIVANDLVLLARYSRQPDTADAPLRLLSSDSCHEEGLPFPRNWCEGLVARLRGGAAAIPVFERGRGDLEKIVHDQPNYAEALCVLGLFDAATGRKEEAIQAGQRAVEILPVSKDSINGALLQQYLALIYAWCGEKDRALDQLASAASLPGYLSYGQLRLDPVWDDLRGDERFQKITARLGPK